MPLALCSRVPARGDAKLGQVQREGRKQSWTLASARQQDATQTSGSVHDRQIETKPESDSEQFQWEGERKKSLEKAKATFSYDTMFKAKLFKTK